MWKEKLKLIEREKSQYGERLNKGAEDKDIDSYLIKYKNFLIPSAYLELLTKMNGFEFDGCILYGIKNFQTNENIFDLYERNEIWYETFDKMTFTFLGETNLCWYVYNKITDRYNILDIPSADMLNECITLNDMLNIFFDEINI